MGTQLIPARDGNPKGFFEDSEVNQINEDLLAKVLPSRPKLLGRWFFQSRPLMGQRWLSALPPCTEIPITTEQIRRIENVVKNRPFCLKDPRFSYTLPAWRPYLPDSRFICVFRDPQSTVNSIMKEVQNEPHLHHFHISFKQALEIWILMYRSIIEYATSENWLFIHCNQILHGDGLQRLADFTQAEVDTSFPDAALQRSITEKPVPERALEVYRKLCELADFKNLKK